MIRRLHTTITLSLFLLASHAVPASAALIQINATDTGAYQSSGLHFPAIQNYITGQFNSEHRSFFVFDLTSVSAPITSATLNLWNPNTNPHPCCLGYRSPSPSETFNLFDVSTPAAALTAGGAGLTSIFQDLGTGSMFGSYVATAQDNGKVISIGLNEAGIAALNDAIGSVIAFGGALGTLSGPADQFVFGFSTAVFAGGDVRRLDLTTADIPEVPEPASLTLLAIGLAGLGRRMRRRV